MITTDRWWIFQNLWKMKKSHSVVAYPIANLSHNSFNWGSGRRGVWAVLPTHATKISCPWT